MKSRLTATLLALLLPLTTATGEKYIILDNDWGITDFTLINMALLSNYTVLGLTSNTGETWALQTSLHALQSLQLLGGNPALTSCVSVHTGSAYPLLNTPELFQAWEALHGPLPYAGVFRPENATAEAAGADPSSGDPSRIVAGSFVGGVAPDPSALSSTPAAVFMIDMVRKYPGQVLIYSAGTMTNIALAVRLDPSFARNTAGLVQMGGYIDTNLYQALGSLIEADINSDFNLKLDPEAAKIALTADFPSIMLVGDAANSVFLTPADLAAIQKVNNTFTQIFAKAFFPVLPLWDPTALAVVLNPELILNSTSFYVDVDVAWYSPFYGEVRPYQQFLKSAVQTNLRTVNYTLAVNEQGVKDMVMQALMYPPTKCQGQ